MVSCFLTEGQDYSVEERVVSSTNSVGVAGMQKNEGGPLLHTVLKNELKMDERAKNINLFEESISKNHQDLGLGNGFL